MAVIAQTARREEMRVDRNPQLRKHAAAFVFRKWTTARAKTSCDHFILYPKLSIAISVEITIPKTSLPVRTTLHAGAGGQKS